MSFAERAKQGPAAHQQPRKLDLILAELPDVESKALRQMLFDPQWSSRGLARDITDEGHPIGSSAVREWRTANGLR